MAISRIKKNEILSKLIDNIKKAKSIGFVQTNGMTVSDFFTLRKELRSVNTTYNITKKTLIKIAVKEALNIDLDMNKLPGQIGIICSNDDAIAGLSKTNAFITKNYNKKAEIQKISWVASIFEGEFKGVEDTKIIASMPSRETLLGRLVGSMQSPIASLARFFDAASKKLQEEQKTSLASIKATKKEEKQEVETNKVEIAENSSETTNKEVKNEEVKA